jgi:hypothetical protein
MVCRQFTIYDLQFTRVKFAPEQIENRKSKIRMARHGHNRGEPWTLNGLPAAPFCTDGPGQVFH